MKSEFAEWFVKQHGARVQSGMPNQTDQQLRDMVQAGKVAERLLARRNVWDEKRTSALYAWQARCERELARAKTDGERAKALAKLTPHERKVLGV